MRFDMTDKTMNKAVMCPLCHRLLRYISEDDSKQHMTVCKHCDKWIWYKGNDLDSFEIHKVPDTRSSSGLTFY